MGMWLRLSEAPLILRRAKDRQRLGHRQNQGHQFSLPLHAGLVEDVSQMERNGRLLDRQVVRNLMAAQTFGQQTGNLGLHRGQIKQLAQRRTVERGHATRTGTCLTRLHDAMLAHVN